MAKKWIAINLLLLLVAVWLSLELYQEYEQVKTKNDSVKIEPIPVENQAAVKTPSGASTDTYMETPIRADVDYFVISEKNLFSETRGRDENDSTVASSVVAPLNPRPVLVGTVMVDDQYTASIIDAASTAARGAQVAPETRRVGDVIRGYTITSIEAEQIVLENSGRREIIQLNRTARRLQPVRPTVASARVVSIGPGGGASGAVTVAMGGAASAPTPGRGGAAQNAAAATAAQTAAAAAAAQNAASAAQNTGGMRQAQNQRGPGNLPPDGNMVIAPPPEFDAQPIQATQPNQPQSRPAQNIQPAPKSPQQRVVRSPFGDIIRPGSE